MGAFLNITGGTKVLWACTIISGQAFKAESVNITLSVLELNLLMLFYTKMPTILW